MLSMPNYIYYVIWQLEIIFEQIFNDWSKYKCNCFSIFCGLKTSLGSVHSVFPSQLCKEILWASSPVIWNNIRSDLLIFLPIAMHFSFANSIFLVSLSCHFHIWSIFSFFLQIGFYCARSFNTKDFFLYVALVQNLREFLSYFLRRFFKMLINLSGSLPVSILISTLK